jgi:hypothetical protein
VAALVEPVADRGVGAGAREGTGSTLAGAAGTACVWGGGAADGSADRETAGAGAGAAEAGAPGDDAALGGDGAADGADRRSSRRGPEPC